MPIDVMCPDCKTLRAAPDDSAGKRFKCGGCGALVDVPAAPARPVDPAHFAVRHLEAIREDVAKVRGRLGCLMAMAIVGLVVLGLIFLSLGSGVAVHLKRPD